MAKSEEPKRRHFHHSLSSNSCESVTIMKGDVSSDNGAILESMGRVSQLTSLATVMHTGLPKMLASSGYKSQIRRSRIKEGEKKKERAERLQKQKGYNLGEQKKIWEIGKIVREQKGEKRKQTEQKQRTRWRDSATPPSSSSSQNQVCSLPFLVPVWWCMLVCKNEKKIIRKPTPETSICNTLFLRFYAL